VESLESVEKEILMINPKSVFAGSDKSNFGPTVTEGSSSGGDVNSRLDDLEQRVSALEKDEASEQDVDSTSNDKNMDMGKPAMGKLSPYRG
jgi:hypothetical protein